MKTTIKSGPVTEARAREIMGKNFFGMDEAVSHFFVVPTEDQMEFLSKVPFSEETLQECKDTHVLVAVFPLSILDMQAMPLDVVNGQASKQLNGTLFYPQNSYDNEMFAEDKGEVGWQLVQKVPVAGSTSRTRDDQRMLLSKDEQIPIARILVYTTVGHFLASGERLFENVCVRCFDLRLGGHRVLVGFFDSDGLIVGVCWDDDRYDNLGLSAARKSDY